MRHVAALALIGTTTLAAAVGRDDDRDRDRDRDRGRVSRVATTPPIIEEATQAGTGQSQFLSCFVTNIGPEVRHIRVEFIDESGQSQIAFSPNIFTVQPEATTGGGTAARGILRCRFTVIDGTKDDIVGAATFTLRDGPRLLSTTVVPAQ